MSTTIEPTNDEHSRALPAGPTSSADSRGEVGRGSFRTPPSWRNNFVRWAAGSVLLLVFAGYAMIAERTPTNAMLLPGETTHGHYQIEIACDACHTPMVGVKQDACLDCHADELKDANDTHPAKKFNDPTNADRLAVLDATKCITCHREHVPQQTHSMGLSVPPDYCFHCHQDIKEQRPSHAKLDFTTCATAGCHNYHDNTALYENFLVQHWGEPELLDPALVPLRTVAETPGKALSPQEQDAPADLNASSRIVDDWGETAHAQAGVNCSACHATGESGLWRGEVGQEACARCHAAESQGFVRGKHGMRLAQSLSPMTPGAARQPMKPAATHRELRCVSCHSDHRFDTRVAAVEACIGCHDDEHTLAYKQSAHYQLWLDEREGAVPTGGGVSCATCHLPRGHDEAGRVVVQHNQNANLRPNEKMVRTVCNHCHGVAFSLDALADRDLIRQCFVGKPSGHVDSPDMAKAWFEAKDRRRSKQSTIP